MNKKIFFQSSLPRSGSTLLQNIMGQNPDFYVTPTSGVLELAYAVRANYSTSAEFKAQDPELMLKGYQAFVRAGFEAFYEAVTDKPYVLDKSRGWGFFHPFIEFFYPNPKIICMIRDLRDVYCSMEKNFRKNQHLHTAMTDHAALTGITTADRIDIWASSQPVGLAIKRLKAICEQGHDRKMLFVKFEDLCLYPEAEMQRIYQYLDLPYFEHDFDNIEQITQEDDQVYGIFGDHKIKPKLELPASTAKKTLGIHETEWIYNNPQYKFFYEKFGYKK